MTASLVTVGAPVTSLRGRLIALAQPARSFARALVPTPFQSVPLLSHPEKQNAPRTCGSDLKKQKISRRVSSIRLLPAR